MIYDAAVQAQYATRRRRARRPEIEHSSSPRAIQPADFLPPGRGKALALFALLGPPIGGVAVFLYGVGYGTILGRGPPEHTTTIFSFCVIFSYFFGAVPGVVTGSIANILRNRGHLRTIRQCLYVAALGGISASLFVLLLLLGDLSRLTSGQTEQAILIIGAFGGLPGFIAACCCALLFRERTKPNSPPSTN